MRWSELPVNPTPRMLRQFAILWILFFGGLAAWHGLGHGESVAGTILAALAIVVGPAGIVRPALLRPVFVTWLALAFPIGWVVSRLLLLILFFLVITPVAVLFRITGRDVLELGRQRKASYWRPKPAPQAVASYLRQF